MHRITRTLTTGLQELQKDSAKTTIAGLPKESFSFLAANVTGLQENFNLTPSDIKTMQGKLAGLPQESAQLDGYLFTYKILRAHSRYTAGMLSVPKDTPLSIEQEKMAVNFVPQQIAYLALAAKVPEQFLNNKTFMLDLGKEILHQDVMDSITQRNTSNSLRVCLQNACGQSGVHLSADLINNLPQHATKAVENLTKKPGDFGTTTGILISSVMLLQNLASEPASPAETPKEEQDKTDYGQIGSLLGYSKAWVKHITEERVKLPEESPVETKISETPPTFKPQPAAEPPSVVPEGFTLIKPPSIPLSGFRSLFSSLSNKIGGAIKGLLQKTLPRVFKTILNWGITVLTGGISKVAALVGKLFSFISSGLLGLDQTKKGDFLKSVSRGAAILLLAIVLVLSFTLFDEAINQPSAIVSPLSTTSQAQMISLVGSLTPSPTTPVPTITHPFPTRSPNLSGDLPDGFPLDNSCVTQIPNQETHAINHLNAIDIGEVEKYGSWVVKSTHSGKVILISAYYDNYGQVVLVEALDKRYITYYAHLEYNSVKVKLGEQVAKGTELGLVDNTGYSSGNHLHYELRGPSSNNAPWGSQEGEFGQTGTILNFLPPKNTWACGANL